MRGALQLLVGDDRDADAVLAVLQLDRDRGLLHHHRQRLAQVVHHGAEAALQIVVQVLRERRRPALLAEGGEVAGQAQAGGVESFRVQHRALLQLHEHRLRAVHRLQQQEVGDLGDAAAAGLRQARRQRLAALVQQAAELAHVAVEDRMALRVHHRRDVLGVEHQLVVGPPLDHPGHADGGIAFAGVALEHQAQVQPADLDRGVAIDVGVAVADLDLGHGVARPHRAGRLLGVATRRCRAAAGRAASTTRSLRASAGMSIAAGAASLPGIENARAVGQHALRRVDAQLAEGQRGVVDGHATVKPQPWPRVAARRWRSWYSVKRSCCWKCWGCRNIPSVQTTLLCQVIAIRVNCGFPCDCTSAKAAAVLLFVQHRCAASTGRAGGWRPRTLLECDAPRNRISAERAQGHEPRRRSSASLVFGGFAKAKIAMIDRLRSPDGTTPWLRRQAPNPAAAHPYGSYGECI